MTPLLKDIEPALSAFMTERAMGRDDAIHHILRRWLEDNGYFRTEGNDAGGPAKPDAGQPDPEYVQYPGYFKDGGSL